MSKVAIIYWSGTGNTEKMAQCLEAGAKEAGAEVCMMAPGDVSAASISSMASVALGCPSMGAEVLEETEFQPMWDDMKTEFCGKKVVLFGSYGWGDGEWMRNWVADAEDAGLNVAESIMCNETPDEDMEAQLIACGKTLA